MTGWHRRTLVPLIAATPGPAGANTPTCWGGYWAIALFRAESGMSRKALADSVGVNPQTIGYLERGEYSPSLALALQIAAELDVPLEEIFSLHPFTSSRIGV